LYDSAKVTETPERRPVMFIVAQKDGFSFCLKVSK